MLTCLNKKGCIRLERWSLGVTAQKINVIKSTGKSLVENFNFCAVTKSF